MRLCRSNLNTIRIDGRPAVPEEIFDLPERVLQFGTGVLLRGLTDHFIDKANRQGIFNGRVVIVKSTAGGDIAAFGRQNGLYTTYSRGIDQGIPMEAVTINSAISRVLSASNEWQSILQCAHDPAMNIVVSNTTEVGIRLTDDDIHATPPESFPGKLLAYLYERYCVLGRSGAMVIVPTELIPDNGKLLQSVLLQLASKNNLDSAFLHWLQHDNHFCSSLVDRIVPGKPDADTIGTLEQRLGYSDELLIATEWYRLWAIEGSDVVRSILTFAAADEGVVIADDITIFRELKLRMLNATHTLTCGLAFLANFSIVRQAMEHPVMSAFISRLMLHDIADAIPFPIDDGTKQAFGQKVLERFRNPYIEHYWINITLQYTSKIKMRVVPILLEYRKRNERVPPHICMGMAAYLLFLRPAEKDNSHYFGSHNGQRYQVNDDYAADFYDLWRTLSPADVVAAVLGDSAMWGEDLTTCPGLLSTVQENLRMLVNDIPSALNSVTTVFNKNE